MGLRLTRKNTYGKDTIVFTVSGACSFTIKTQEIRGELVVIEIDAPRSVGIVRKELLDGWHTMPTPEGGNVFDMPLNDEIEVSVDQPCSFDLVLLRHNPVPMVLITPVEYLTVK